MWRDNWRDNIWQSLDRRFDLIIIGGGITGAGILREAVRLGLEALLVDQKDFAWGTSSRSSKLVHGGLRYLQSFQIGLTRASVRERDRLVGEAPGLIDPLGFLLANYAGDAPGRWTFAAGLSVYDLLALHWSHRHFSAQDFQMLAPHLTSAGLEGGFRYGDAQTDDARLVLRVLQEAAEAGATAINYVRAGGLLQDESGSVIGVRLHDAVGDRETECRARVVINATGAWADQLRSQVGGTPRLRPLRGSHLIFPSWRFPTAQAISFLHPIDRRPVFVFPWEGITLVGTTDVDHGTELSSEPSISPEEVSYLMAAVQSQFAPLALRTEDVTATFAGIRPVIDTGKEDPSKESRDHIIWEESGLVTVTGGKLTTFRLIALDALRSVRHLFPELDPINADEPVLEPVDETLLSDAGLNEQVRRRLVGRYGNRAPALVTAAAQDELRPIPGTATLWAELRWGARAEGVVHLDDLLFRRVRLGLLLPGGGQTHLGRIRAICQAELGWGDARWEEEEKAYLQLWQSCYQPPHPDTVPDWRPALAAARAGRGAPGGPRRYNQLILAASLCLLGAALAAYYWRLRKRSQRALI
jgi:glycerol-3-phosphate dehydrogenase